LLNYSPYFRISCEELYEKLEKLKGCSELFGAFFSRPLTNKEIVSSIMTSCIEGSEGGRNAVPKDVMKMG